MVLQTSIKLSYYIPRNIGDAFLLVWKIPVNVIKIVNNEKFKVRDM
jgi:hypothetical protein